MSDQNTLPLYVQLAEMLIREINSGLYIDGARLPPEREMAARLGTSVGTLRKALSDVEAKGLLERRQGSGNYVRVRADTKSVYALFRVELLGGGGGLPTAQVLSVDRVPKPDGLPDFGPSPDAHRIRRLRRLNDVPCVLEEIFLDGAQADSLAPGDLTESLYLHYRTRLALWITRAEDKLGLDAVPDWAPDAFGPRPGAVCLCAWRTSWDREDRRAEASRNWIDTDRARYVARLR